MLENSFAEENSERVAVVIGASSKIATALIEKYVKAKSFTKIFAVTRRAADLTFSDLGQTVQCVQCDYSDDSVRELCEQLRSYKGLISQVFICNGILHDSYVSPEKRVDDVTPENLHRVFEVNAVIPMLWVKHLRPILAGKQSCVVTAFSARIGSIEDNRRGGWYSYRASKAALNMLLKTASIEYSRVAKGVRFLVFHPGTTDTPLSKPFQKFVSKDKLFSPEFVADQLINLVALEANAKPIQFLDWDGKPIPW